MKIAKWALILIALAAVILSLTNASWIAPKPTGKLILVAHRGTGQPAAAGASGDCPGVAITASGHNYLENSVHGMKAAAAFGGDALALPVQRTSDGLIVIFSDPALDCRTDVSGPVAARSLAELKRLDAGHDYTPDGGRTFPVRGRIGGIQTLDEVLSEMRGQRFIFRFVGDDPAAADALAATFERAGAKIDPGTGFLGPKAATDRMKQLAPEAWVYDPAQSRACLAGYARTGWAGIIPPECRDAVLVVPYDSGWTIWGWPYRFLDRMAGVGAEVMLVASLDANGHPLGLTEPQQLGDVPRHFRGMLWVENMYEVGRALN